MICDERERLRNEWLAEHDRLCVALDEYERKLAKVKEFDETRVTAPDTRTACNRAREMLDQHERDHGCCDLSFE